MKIAVICHDADFTGAPRIGFDIASSLATTHDVALIAKHDGPLIELPKYARLQQNYVVTPTSHKHGLIPFNERINLAVEMLQTIRPDVVYANSTASCEWCVAARYLSIPSVLHTHEMEQELRSLLAADVLKRDIPSYVDLLVSASQEATDAFAAQTSGPIARHFLFGVGIDTDHVKEMAQTEVPLPLNIEGHELTKRRPIVAMCGTAGFRKGFDIFFETARMMPDADFLWIGPLSDDPLVLRVLDQQKSERLKNLYITGPTSNPYAYMKMCDVFALTSIEDPNPLVVPEALTLGRRVVTFHDTGGSWQWTRQFGYSLSGKITSERLARFLRSMLATPLSSNWIEGQASAIHAAADLGAKLALLRQELSKLLGGAV